MDTMIELPAMRRSAELAPNTADADSRTVEVVWSTGARVPRAALFGEPHGEELSMAPEHVRLERLNAGAPFLKVHEAHDLEAMIDRLTISVVQGKLRYIQGSMSSRAMELSENEKLVSEVPQAFRKYLVRKGSEFEGLVGVNAGDRFIELAETSFVATSSNHNPNAAENRIDLTAVSILPNLIYLNLESKTILSSQSFDKGFRNLHDVNFYRCIGVGEFFDRELPKLRLVTLEACDILDLSGFMNHSGLKVLNLRGTPISRAFRETSPSKLDRIYSTFFPQPRVDKPAVSAQIERLGGAGVKVEF